MNDIMDLIQENIGIGPSVQVQIARTVIIIILMTVLYTFVKRILYKLIESTKTYYRVKKIASYILLIFAIVMIARVWFVGVRSITTFIGLFSAGLAIAMKDLVMNLAGWVFIVTRKPFRVGDRIEIEGVSGDVIDIKIFDFSLMETGKWIKADQSSGRIVSIPNRDIFNHPLFNYSQGIPFIWSEIDVCLTFESNWRKAKKILQEISDKHGEKIQDQAEESIKEASKRYMIFNAKLEPTVYTSTNNNGIVLTIRCLCYYRGKRDVEQKIWESILSSFETHDDIEFSYPTQRVYDRPTEK